MLEFLAVRPGLSFANQPIFGVGAGILFSVVDLAQSLGIQMIWGEATATSAPFYEKVLRTRPIKDLFIIHSASLLAGEEKTDGRPMVG